MSKHRQVALRFTWLLSRLWNYTTFIFDRKQMNQFLFRCSLQSSWYFFIFLYNVLMLSFLGMYGLTVKEKNRDYLKVQKCKPQAKSATGTHIGTVISAKHITGTRTATEPMDCVNTARLTQELYLPCRRELQVKVIADSFCENLSSEPKGTLCSSLFQNL